jgi:hypothetical protein
VVGRWERGQCPLSEVEQTSLKRILGLDKQSLESTYNAKAIKKVIKALTAAALARFGDKTRASVSFTGF